MMALGVTFSDAAQATKWILASAPEDANLDTWLPTPAQLDAAAQITDADIADARAEWLIRPDNAGRWQFILDAVVEVEEFDPDQPRDEQGRWTSGGGAGISSPKATVSIAKRGSVATIERSAFSTPEANTTERVRDIAANTLASSWTVERSDLDAWAAEEGIKLPDDDAAAKRQMIGYTLAHWAGSSGSPAAFHMAAAVCDDLGMSYSVSRKFGYDKTEEWFAEHPAADRAVKSLGREMYATTQSWLADRGISSVQLYRVGGQSEDRAFSSWSVDRGGVRWETGKEFVTAIVPANHILSTPATGFGVWGEGEVVVLSRVPGAARVTEVGEEFSA